MKKMASICPLCAPVGFSLIAFVTPDHLSQAPYLLFRLTLSLFSCHCLANCLCLSVCLSVSQSVSLSPPPLPFSLPLPLSTTPPPPPGRPIAETETASLCRGFPSQLGPAEL